MKLWQTEMQTMSR